MVARRTASEPEVNPAPPGQTGGQFRPLSESGIRRIYRMALRLLSELGMGECPDVLVERSLEARAFRNADGRLCFPESMVEDLVAGAACSITLHGRDPSRSITVGGDSVHFGTGGAAVQTLDLETATYRPSTIRDLRDFTRLQDVLTNISWFTRCCIATDIDDPFDLDINTAHALLAGTTKPVATAFSHPDNVAHVVRLFDLAEGRDGRFRERPWCAAHISPVISPMRFGDDAVMTALQCIRHNIPISCITAAQSGATAPAVPAAFLATSLAETLASLIMVNLFRPGHPMIFSNWPLVIDLRTGAFSGGGGESAIMNAASAQISNWLGLPSGIAAGMSDAKAIDAQMGAEKGITALATGLAGGNMIYESAGMMASLLGTSFEAFVLDNEMNGQVYRVIRGIEVSEDRLVFDDIRHSVLTHGHFLASQETMRAMQRDYVYPELADRNPPEVWAQQGARDIRDMARRKARQILDTHRPEYLSAAADAQIRQEFRIYP
ncbi:MAG: trimethylamine methyltransferase family protein [Paracoccaceae bacterium]|nr:trimethylamine methyltransferase family protein [Paracoccaceae bacterium]